MKIISSIQNKIFVILFLFICSPLSAEVAKPIQWDYAFNKESFYKGDTVDIIFYADIEREWYLYSSDFDKNVGPLVTEFFFTPDSSFTLIGNIRAIQSLKKYDSLFGGEYLFRK